MQSVWAYTQIMRPQYTVPLDTSEPLITYRGIQTQSFGKLINYNLDPFEPEFRVLPDSERNLSALKAII